MAPVLSSSPYISLPTNHLQTSENVFPLSPAITRSSGPSRPIKPCLTTQGQHWRLSEAARENSIYGYQSSNRSQPPQRRSLHRTHHRRRQSQSPPKCPPSRTLLRHP